MTFEDIRNLSPLWGFAPTAVLWTCSVAIFLWGIAGGAVSRRMDQVMVGCAIAGLSLGTPFGWILLWCFCVLACVALVTSVIGGTMALLIKLVLACFPAWKRKDVQNG